MDALRTKGAPFRDCVGRALCLEFSYDPTGERKFRWRRAIPRPLSVQVRGGG